MNLDRRLALRTDRADDNLGSEWMGLENIRRFD